MGKEVKFATRGDEYIGEVVSEKVSGKYLIRYFDTYLGQYKLITKRKQQVKEI